MFVLEQEATVSQACKRSSLLSDMTSSCASSSGPCLSDSLPLAPPCMRYTTSVLPSPSKYNTSESPTMRLSYRWQDLVAIGSFGTFIYLVPSCSRSHSSCPPEGKIFAAKITGMPVHNDEVRQSIETDVVAMKKARVTNHIRHPLLLHEACVLTLLQGKPVSLTMHRTVAHDVAHSGHPNIHRVFAWGRSQYFEYMAMELLGPNVEDFVSAVGLSQRNAVALVCQMVRSF